MASTCALAARSVLTIASCPSTEAIKRGVVPSACGAAQTPREGGPVGGRRSKGGGRARRGRERREGSGAAGTRSRLGARGALTNLASTCALAARSVLTTASCPSFDAVRRGVHPSACESAQTPREGGPVGGRRSKGGVRFGACTGVRPFSPRSRGGERLRVRQVGSFGVPVGRASWFLWPQSAHAATRPARGGRAAEASAHILKVDVFSAVDQPTDLRVAPVKCGIEQVGHLRARFREPLLLIVLARATDEQVAMHVSERRLWMRDCALEIQNASLVTVTRARDGARSQTSAQIRSVPKGAGAPLRA